jgi:hypothetical protein
MKWKYEDEDEKRGAQKLHQLLLQVFWQAVSASGITGRAALKAEARLGPSTPKKPTWNQQQSPRKRGAEITKTSRLHVQSTLPHQTYPYRGNGYNNDDDRADGEHATGIPLREYQYLYLPRAERGLKEARGWPDRRL